MPPRLDPSHPKERSAGHGAASGKSRKNGNSALNSVAQNNKDAASIASTSTGTAPNGAIQPGAPGIIWASEDVSIINNYRGAYNLDSPAAFKSPLSTAVLTTPGIGRHSPTMARRKDKRKVAKEQLALAVRKHFNALAVNETDAVVEFLYSVKSQDSGFRLRFAAAPKSR